MTSWTFVEPPGPVAVTVWMRSDSAVGVPVMTPVPASKIKPAGSAGRTDHVSTVPETLGALEAIASPTR